MNATVGSIRRIRFSNTNELIVVDEDRVTTIVFRDSSNIGDGNGGEESIFRRTSMDWT